MMANETYDYREAIKEDLKQFIKEEVDLDEFKDESGGINRDAAIDHIYDVAWGEDSVTGCQSGSYTCNRYKAEKNLAGNLNLLVDALEEFGAAEGRKLPEMLRDPEDLDVSLRCFLVGEMVPEALDSVLEELEENRFNEEIEDENFPEETEKVNDGIYNYEQEITEDLEQFIKDNIDLNDDDFKDDLGNLDKDAVIEKVSDMVWNADEVTGNGSGSYTFSTLKAEQNLAGNFDLLAEALEELGYDEKKGIEELRNPEGLDVTIRCWMVDQMIPDALDNILDEMEENRTAVEHIEDNSVRKSVYERVAENMDKKNASEHTKDTSMKDKGEQSL